MVSPSDGGRTAGAWHRHFLRAPIGEITDSERGGKREPTRVTVENSIHRALSEPNRRALLDVLGRARAGLSAGELAAELHLHPNTVRAHLELLRRAGLVTSMLEERHRPGRPRRLFRARPRSAADEHQLLAAGLAGSLDPLPDGPRLAEEAGRRWGRHLVERPAPDERVDEIESEQRVCDLLDERGFSPELDGRVIRMRNCPFRELAERYPRVVCALHRGLLNGALEELDAPVRVATLTPWVTPETCEAELVEAVAPRA
jgi:predicted ArsR family transcriptional regulator